MFAKLLNFSRLRFPQKSRLQKGQISVCRLEIWEMRNSQELSELEEWKRWRSE
jgi:hypothetical protein